MHIYINKYYKSVRFVVKLCVCHEKINKKSRFFDQSRANYCARLVQLNSTYVPGSRNPTEIGQIFITIFSLFLQNTYSSLFLTEIGQI